MPTQRPRYKSIFVIEMHLDSGMLVFGTDDLLLAAPSPTDVGVVGGYGYGGYSGVTTSDPGNQGYDL